MKGMKDWGKQTSYLLLNSLENGENTEMIHYWASVTRLEPRVEVGFKRGVRISGWCYHLPLLTHGGEGPTLSCDTISCWYLPKSAGIRITGKAEPPTCCLAVSGKRAVPRMMAGDSYRDMPFQLQDHGAQEED